MPQKFFEPWKKLPQQFQNLNLIQKLQGLNIGRSVESFGSFLASTYGCIQSPTAIAFDEKLGLLAIGSRKGVIRVYGTPGVVLAVSTGGPGVVQLSFLPEEGRLVAALTDGALCLYELDTRSGSWSESSRLSVTNAAKEQITSLELGCGIIYIGSSTGVLYQIAVKNGRMSLGDQSLTSLTGAMILENVPVEKRNELGVDSPIVALRYQPENSLLLVAYSGGCVAVVVPQSVPEANGVEQPPSNIATPEPDPAISTPTHAADATQSQPDQNIAESGDAVVAPDQSADADVSTQQTIETPVKGHSEKRATLKIKEFTRSLRRFELTKQEAESEPPLPVPPPPRVSHILLRDQPVECATWRISAVGVPSNEVTVAYGDGAFQVWPISTSVVDKDVLEPIIVSMRDPPSTPYGPLPCGAIKKITQSPGPTASMLTVFSGGLPRAEFHDRHAVSVLQDPEHHVCFQFGSKVVDFILLPQKVTHLENGTDTAAEQRMTCQTSPQNSSVLLVLTERELVAVDLQHPNWPTFASPYLNCFDLSPVTAVTHLTKISSSLLSRLRDSAWYDSNEVTRSQWPVYGGGNCDDNLVDLSHNDCNDVVILGHANGWITLLGIGRGDTVHRLGSFHTEVLFNLTADSKCPCPVEVETWPPFRRVGDCAMAEPFCQQTTSEPRLAITQLAAYSTPTSITLVVGGAAGQVSLWTIDEEESSNTRPCFEPDVSRILVNLIDQDPSNPKYVWDGPSALKPFEGVAPVYGNSGSTFSPRALIQFNPPAPITSVAFEGSWNLLAAGCSLGFAVIDTLSKAPVHSELVLPQLTEQHPGATRKLSRSVNVASVQTALANRGKQITAQLRQSFRRLKHMRTSTSTATPTKADESETPAVEPVPAEVPPPVDQPEAQPETPADPVAAAEPSEPATKVPEPESSNQPTEQSAVPVTDAAEDAPAEAAIIPPPEPVRLAPEDPISHAVRSLLFIDTYIISAIPATAHQPAVPSPRTPCLLVGTASGRALAYGLIWDGSSGPVTIQLHKELQLRHRAPIVGLCVIDASSRSPVLTSPRTRTGYELVTKAANDPAPDVTDASKDDQPDTNAETVAAPVHPPAAVLPDHHQLILCSEEQVKLFQLPTLRALHKYKFIDRLRLPGHLGISVGVNSHNVGSETAAVKPEKDVGAEKDDSEAKPAVSTNEVESKSSQTMCQLNGKSVRAFGVQAFVRVAGTDQTRTEWNVVVARQDGQIVILSLPHLRKLFKVKPTSETTLLHCVPCVASLSDANYVFWQSACQLLAYELAPNPRLMSPALVVPPGSHKAPVATIVLPDWARPQQQQQPVDETADGAEAAVAAATNGADTAELPLIDASVESLGHVVNGAAEVQYVEPIESVHPLPEKYNPTAALHAGDMTIDSIKEYLNGEGTVTIKTIETSTEKRTLVEGGHVVTTVRETECVDGQITKDDVLKFSTDDPVAPQAILESS